MTCGFLLTSVGCNKQLAEDQVGPSSEFTFKVEAADAFNGSPKTRSSYVSDLQNKITDFSIFVFDSKDRLVSKNYYGGSDTMHGRDLFVNNELGASYDNTFEVYIIANLGDLRNESTICTNGQPVMSKIKEYSYSFSDDFSEFNEKGFPMAGYYENYCPVTDNRTLYANKIVTQYNIRFTKSSSNPNTYTITGGKLVNVPNKCTPFKTFKATAKAERSTEGDYFTDSDITALNSGSSMPLFVLENEQGIAFPSSIRNEKDKKLENINSGYGDLCTYAEFYVTVQTPTARYDNVTYRYFFGDNIRDCSIHRNMIYELTMSFDNVVVEDEGWRIEPGIPTVDTSAISFNRTQLSIIKGMSNTFSVTKKAGVDYKIYYSSTDATTYGLSVEKSTSGNTDTYTVSTSWSGYQTTSGLMPKVNYKDIPITFTTVDGLVSKEFVVRIQLRPIVLTFNCPDGMLEVEVDSDIDWPEGSQFVYKFSGTIFGENVFCNNRAFNRYTCEIWPQNIGEIKGATPIFFSHTILSLNKFISGTASLQTAMHNMTSSHITSHAYKVGKETNHYTAIGNAYLKIQFGFAKVSGNSIQTVYSDIPVIYSNTFGIRDIPDGYTYVSCGLQSDFRLTCKSSNVPAWPYGYGSEFDNDSVDLGYIYEWSSPSEFTVISGANTYGPNDSIVEYPKIYSPDGFYKFKYNGSESSSVNAYSGVYIIYNCPTSL